MGLFSSIKSKFFKTRPRTYSASFSSYRSTRTPSRTPRPNLNGRNGRSESWPDRAKRILKWLTLISVMIGIIVITTFTSTFEIQKIDIVGGAETLNEQSEMNQQLSAHLGENLLWINTLEIETALLDRYPYLKELNVRRRLPKTLKVTVETHPIAANIILRGRPEGDLNFIVNSQGYIASIGEQNETLPSIFMSAVGVQELQEENTANSSQENPDGEATTELDEQTDAKTPFQTNQALIDPEVLTTILETANDFEGRFNLTITSIDYRKAARELHLTTERNFVVWMDLTQDLGFQLTKLKKALSALNIYESPLEYIDLRISGQNGEKVIYKLRKQNE